MTLPAFGVGTFRLQGRTVLDSLGHALDVGYRAIDTAQIYDNEAEVGQALAESGVPRDEVFLTTKIWTANYRKDALISSLRASLDKLRTDVVDLTLIHWPAPNGPVPLEEFMEALAEARSQGLTRQIGISNFSVALTRRAIDVVGKGVIATNQIELSPFLQNRTLTRYLMEQAIPVTSYMTLAYGKALQDPVIQQIAKRNAATPAQVVLAWALQQGYAVIPSSTRKEHLQGNLQARTLNLGAEDMAAIQALDCGGRQVNPAGLAPDWDD